MQLRTVCLAVFAMALMTKNAFAYIDPGTGSVVTTAIIGFFAAGAYTLRKYLYRIKDAFSSKEKRSSSARVDDK